MHLLIADAVEGIGLLLNIGLMMIGGVVLLVLGVLVLAFWRPRQESKEPARLATTSPFAALIPATARVDAWPGGRGAWVIHRDTKIQVALGGIFSPHIRVAVPAPREVTLRATVAENGVVELVGPPTVLTEELRQRLVRLAPIEIRLSGGRLELQRPGIPQDPELLELALDLAARVADVVLSTEPARRDDTPYRVR